MPNARTLFLDTETTGLSPGSDELVEIALIDEHGTALIDTLVRPVRVTRWDDAARIHGITPAMVRDAMSLEELTPALLHHMTGAELVVYNAGFDLPFLPPDVRAAPARVHCAMLRFAEYYGDWNDYRQSYRWQRLTTAAAHVGHVWSGAAHRAAADATACRSVWRYLELPDAARALMREQAEQRAADIVDARIAASAARTDERIAAAGTGDPDKDIPF